MSENIIVRIEVDGVELAPINMGHCSTNRFYETDMQFYSMGNVFNKEHTLAPYEYLISLTRHKTKKEKA